METTLTKTQTIADTLFEKSKNNIVKTMNLTDSEWEKLFPPEPRFFEKKKKTDSCWNWIGASDRKGYGIFTIGSKKNKTHRNIYAHRWSYERFVAEIPQGLVIDHLCRNPKCVNPAHLEPVTAQVNLLRGIGVAAQNAQKTHCKNGHIFNDENTYLHGSGNNWRRCRACNRINKQKEFAKKRGEIK